MFESALTPNHGAVARAGTGRLIRTPEGAAAYRLERAEELPPFFMALVSPGDGWAFLASHGALTAGRRSPDEALLPYRTDDQLLDSLGHTGGHTAITPLGGDGRPGPTWRPFAPACGPGEPPSLRRAVEKTVLSDEIVLDEDAADLGLVVRIGWRHSPEFGLVRTTQVRNTGTEPVHLRVRDGVLNLLPPGATARVQRELSNLLDAYKLTELDREHRLMWTRLNSGLTDLAEPCESLRATTAWVDGFAEAELSIDPDRPAAEHTRGRRAHVLLDGEIDLAPGASRSWRLVLDTGLDAAAVATLRTRLGEPATLAEALDADLAAARARLDDLVAGADGVQATGDATASAHHASSVLFNLMRGGVPATGLQVDRADVLAFVQGRNREVGARHHDALVALPAQFPFTQLTRLAEATDDPDLRRLLASYLPLTFSRRHGDPTRPWNSFRIMVADEAGDPVLRYEGNWRDLFQNWEALAYSYPPLTDAMVRIFLDAMTLDGYNPYRVSTDGVDWEMPDPDDPWSGIGYWSDHQVPYLLALLDARERLLGPPSPATLLRPDHVYADVPYRIGGYQALVDDPANGITVDDEAHAAAEQRAARLGGDGRLVTDAQGAPVRATLLEKLLLIAGAKMVNLAPGAGLWMNTQRPEWNDANNALVGRGFSVVSVAQLVPFLDHLLALVQSLPEGQDVPVTPALAQLWTDLAAVLEHESGLLGGPLSPADRSRIMARLGGAGERFRERRYRDRSGPTGILPRARAEAALISARAWLTDVLDRSWSPEGLIASYGTLTWRPDGVHAQTLGPMLEGQAAAVASGYLTPAAAADLLDALRASPLWCPQRGTYLLYPDRVVAGFLERTAIPSDAAARLPLLARLEARGDRRLVARGADGILRFGGDLRNERDVRAMLDDLATAPDLADAVDADRDGVLALFEQVFDHASFTGRAGTFFAYEGLGSVYWHMVSKLLLAVHRLIDRGQGSAATMARLRAHAEAIRAGLGHTQRPQDFGAIPLDPYSHTPAGRGAQQPGMTGQVKEDILIRWSELGVDFHDGSVTFRPDRVAAREWTLEGTLTFTWCGIPITYDRNARARSVQVEGPGQILESAGWTLPAQAAREVAERTGTVTGIHVLGG